MPIDGASPRARIGRRQLATGLAWAVPTVLVATPTVAYAASNCLGGLPAPQFLAPAPSTSSAASITTPFVVPAGVTRLCFRVTGGAGGGTSTRSGGSGGLVTGILVVTPGETLTLVLSLIHI